MSSLLPWSFSILNANSSKSYQMPRWWGWDGHNQPISKRSFYLLHIFLPMTFGDIYDIPGLLIEKENYECRNCVFCLLADKTIIGTVLGVRWAASTIWLSLIDWIFDGPVTSLVRYSNLWMACYILVNINYSYC